MFAMVPLPAALGLLALFVGTAAGWTIALFLPPWWLIAPLVLGPLLGGTLGLPIMDYMFARARRQTQNSDMTEAVTNDAPSYRMATGVGVEVQTRPARPYGGSEGKPLQAEVDTAEVIVMQSAVVRYLLLNDGVVPCYHRVWAVYGGHWRELTSEAIPT